MMSYYDTIAEDLRRAREILEKGKPDVADFERLGITPENIGGLGGTIYGGDVYAAYRLLESFVEAIEAVGPKACELAVQHARRLVPPV